MQDTFTGSSTIAVSGSASRNGAADASALDTAAGTAEMVVLVVDSGAIIKGHGTNFHKIATRFVTIDEVVAEIRDSKSRDLLLKLPFELEICSVSESSMRAVADFTRRSGDFANLSLTDLKVLALTHSLEVEKHNNGAHLRADPVAAVNSSQVKQTQAHTVQVSNIKGASNKKKSKVFEDNSLPEADPTAKCDCGTDAANIHTHTVAMSPAPPTLEQDERHGRPCSPPSGEAAGQAQFRADRLEWLAARAAGAGDQVRTVEAGGGFAADAPANIPAAAVAAEDAGKEDDDEEELQIGEGDVDGDYWDDEEGYYSEDSEEDSSDDEPAPEPQPDIDVEAMVDQFPSLGMGGPAAAAPASKWASIATSADAAASTGAVHFARAVPLGKESIMDATTRYSAVDHFCGDGSNLELMQHLKEEARVDSLKEAARANEQLNREKAGVDYDKKQAMPSRIMGANNGGTSRAAMEKARAEDDGEGWIGTANLKECVMSGKNMIGNQTLLTTAAAAGDDDDAVAKKKKKNNQKKKKSKNTGPAAQQVQPNNSPVGCVTTDFTMQNVMLQMNLRVVSVDGMLVRSIRQWVMRCMACYTVHTDMNRIFCSRCGVDHMSRVACSVDASTGQLRLHLKSNYTVSKRGKQYSMPAPGKQGRFEGELLTREDQLLGGIWRQKVVKMQKDVRSAFGQDVTSDVGLQVNKSVHIRPGLGRINPNADKGRERRGKSKRKK